MGTIGWLPNVSRLMCLCLITCAVLCYVSCPADANTQVDSDLVFENLDVNANEEHHISKRNAHQHRTNLHKKHKSSHHQGDEDHWLSSSIQRIKRNFNLFDIFGSSSTTETPDAADDNINEPGDPDDILPVDEEELDGEDLEGEEGDDERNYEDDDEDNAVSGSGVIPDVTEHGNPVYYRSVFSVHEPYVPQYSDPNSQQFKGLSEQIINSVDKLYDSLDGTQSSTVIKIEPVAGEHFVTKVTLDLGSIDFYNTVKIKEVLFNQIYNYRRLGNLTVDPHEFTFFKFEAPSQCIPPHIPCQNDCLPPEARCNGIVECPDNSDEANCAGPSIGEKENDITERILEISTERPRPVETTHIITEAPTTPAPTTTSTIESAQPRTDCRADDFVRCTDGSTTICADQECDGVPDCPDGGDERNCSECAQGEFSCDIVRCIPESQRCNGVADCQDGTDERACKETQCTGEQFKCRNGRCIDANRRCDRVDDCGDASDEQDCIGEPAVVCKENEFQCLQGECIAGYKKCNGIRDCSDGSDEENCPISTESPACKSDEFQCVHTGECIKQTYICDTFTDCRDGSDEENCERGCESNEFTCGDGSCIDQSKKCDRNYDCSDRTDEEDCVITCGPNEFTCNDGSCIPKYLQCDGSPQCRDRSDEIACGCRDEEFTCANGQCVPAQFRCNQISECPDGSDEHNCPPPGCPHGQIPCRTQNECYPASGTCDGYNHCRDGSDETNCNDEEKACRAGQFRCENGPCILETLQCDGKVDCPFDSSDELDCPEYSHGYHYNITLGLNLRTYPSAQDIKESMYKPGREVVFQCRDEGPMRARVHWIRGNGRPLPPGSRDIGGRLEMPNIKIEHSGTYICQAVGIALHTPGSQVSVQLNVEPFLPQPTRPPQACGLHEATCSNGDCIAKHLVCDGKFDCKDGSDETRCSAHGCEPNEFRCSNKRCVLKTWVCDSDDDCGDGSDEENCATNPPGSPCDYSQFACRSGNQCIPKSFHCDQEKDCVDGSDEFGCSPVTISRPPPPMIELDVGSIFIITCTAVGVPTPEVVWRLNWGHIPEKCSMTSVNGLGTLTCPDIQEHDQGAYSCEAINIRGSIIAVPDTILVVRPTDTDVCPRGYFNDDARKADDCISCFCFGVTDDCHSADLFTYQLQPPFDSHKIMGVRVDPDFGTVEIRNDPIYKYREEPRLTPTPARNGVHAYLMAAELNQPLVPYFVMPENYNGNQLKSYGGYLKYNLRFEGYGRPITKAPDVILSGNGYTLLHVGKPHQSSHQQEVTVRFFYGEWIKRPENAPETLASREEIMMALASTENILIKLQYVDGHLDTTLENIEMDSAAVRNTGLGQAVYVEECRCPVGYTGLSCENCAPGYNRHDSGPWLGKCYKEPEVCPSGTYGDPSRNIPCQVCPCPLTSPSNQFGKSCSLAPDGQVTCDCQPGYVGRRCEQCALGYTGNPLIPGDYCRPGHCNVDGSLSQETDRYGNCMCKDLADGPTCDHCKANTFYLSATNQFGCIACFCMGVTDQCTSSNWYRDTISTIFTRSRSDFKIVDTQNKENPTESGIELNQDAREIVYNNFSSWSPDVKYWVLPSRYLGNKITAYGGNLKFSFRYVPTPGGQSSRNTAPNVELLGKHHVRLSYYHREQPLPNTLQTITVPLLEQYWQRDDGEKTDREHLLMALADVKAIIIKATYTTNSREVALSRVSLDIADERNTGSLERALPVEQCRCPPGYKGLSCENCDVGYTRSTGGIYLGLCEKCDCNGHSNECDSETGECLNCRDYTTGEKCEKCQPGYEGDPTNRIPCRYIGPSDCICNEMGSVSTHCYGGQCECKTNVIGQTCSRCRPGTFGLNASLPEGCQACFCSGVTTECSESNLYIEQIPSQIFDNNHGFSLVDQQNQRSINFGFEVKIALNEIGYVFRPSESDQLFWSLPNMFTGYKITSYGGKLEFTQRYTERPNAKYVMNKDVIINGNGITIYWTNPQPQQPNIANKISVVLSPTANWQRLERQGARPASREDILRVLANIERILIRAQKSSDTASSYISDITLDTAVQHYTGQDRATNVEVCRCPIGYKGTSCELCASGYYRDINDVQTGPLGSCSRCPCNGNEESCGLGPDNRVVCSCLPGYIGDDCRYHSVPTAAPPTTAYPPTLPPPRIVINITSPEIQIVNAGSNVRFYCQAKSTTPNAIRITWSKDGDILPDRAIDDSRGLLVITDVRISDSGRYICQASDGVIIESKYVTLTVGGNEPTSPWATISPTGIDVLEGEPIELRCQARGNPTPYLQWTRADGLYLNPQHSMINGILRINNALLSDSGEYKCTATNNAGSHVAYAKVIVKESTQIREPIITPPYYHGRIGDTVILRCYADVPVLTTWSKQDSLLPINANQLEGTLRIVDARVEDSGTYVCTATSPSTGGQGIKTATVTISGQEGSLPLVDIRPKNQTVAQGSTVELFCDGSGTPTPSIKWTKVHEELGPNAQQIGSMLRIQNVQVRDRGIYVCVVTNAAGLVQGSSYLEVERRESPLVEIYPPGVQTLREGASAIMQCRVMAGIPQPTITWTRRDGLYLSRNIDQQPNGVMRFNDITKSEAGEYICTASNEAGTVTGSGTIVVQIPPNVTIMQSSPLMVREGSFVRLECTGTGEPTPNILWSRHGQEDLKLVDGYGRGVSHVAVYEITNVASSDESVYICRGDNPAGIAEKHIQLIVDSLPTRGDITDEDPGSDKDPVRPYPPIQPRLKDNEITPNIFDERFTAPVGTRAELRCRVNNLGRPEQQIHMKWVRADNSSLPYDSYLTEGTLFINNVQPSDAGLYRCLGIEQSGRVLFTVTANLEVLSPPRITLEPSRQVVKPYDDAIIQCRAVGDEPIAISWHAIGRSLPESAYAQDGYLQFRGIKVSDAGKYRCTATNLAGEADAVAEVLVNEKEQKPTVSAENREQIAKIGSSVTLHCVVAHPSNEENVRWFRQHQPLPANSQINGGYLQIYNLQPTDAGRYYCEVPFGDSSSSDYINLHVESEHLPTEIPQLDIQPHNPSIHIGDYLDINCRSNEPGVIITWSKVNGKLADNVQTSAGTLRLSSVRPENVGTYRCEARGPSGYYHRDYPFDLVESNLAASPAKPPIDKKIAPQGAMISMECNTDLEEPVSYVWRKEGGNLPRSANPHSRVIQINDLSSNDAGTYVCSASNGKQNVDAPTILVVTGIVPYFNQAPNSFIALPTLPDHYLQFSFEISFKPESYDGLILYNGEKGNTPKSDFISLALVNGVPEFKFNLGQDITIITADRPIEIGKWHTIKVNRNKKKGTMYVDGNGPFTGTAEGRYRGLSLKEPLYLGGVPDYSQIVPEVGMGRGFVGCISQFKIGHMYHDIIRESNIKSGVTTCETCTDNPCQNEGVCQEALSKEGFTCICPEGYSGPTCSKMGGEQCTPYACGKGRCVSTDESYECYCPLGHAGRRCEREVSIFEPAFTKGSYVAYPTINARRMKLSLKIKPKTVEDSILLYCGESDDGVGNFASLAIKDGHIEFRIDVGNGPMILRSEKQLHPEEWVAVTATKTLLESRLMVNGESPVVMKMNGNHKSPILNTPLYVGGYDKEKVTINDGVGVNAGFNGCVSEINISGTDLNMIESSIGSANVLDCSAIDESTNEVDNSLTPYDDNRNMDRSITGCSNLPCRNEGQCTALSSTDYTCYCVNGYSGRDCEIAPNQCDQLVPCQNGGTCTGTTTSYICDCPLGYTGTNCEQRSEIRNEAHFDGNGYLEFSRSLLSHENDDEEETIAFQLSTNSSNGLIFWHGQTPNENGEGQDYIALAVVNDYLEFSFDMGSGSTVIRSEKIRINDGNRHTVVLKRKGKYGSIEIDDEYFEEGQSFGLTSQMNCHGNIYLGGTPNLSHMTGKYYEGFKGCIHAFEIQNSQTLELGTKALSGVNVKACSNFDYEDYDADNFTN